MCHVNNIILHLYHYYTFVKVKKIWNLYFTAVFFGKEPAVFIIFLRRLITSPLRTYLNNWLRHIYFIQIVWLRLYFGLWFTMHNIFRLEWEIYFILTCTETLSSNHKIHIIVTSNTFYSYLFSLIYSIVYIYEYIIYILKRFEFWILKK